MDCSRCGIDVSPVMIAKAASRGQLYTTCVSCRANPQKQLGECRPWSGDFADDLVTPVKNGVPYKPGRRLCGNADCVAAKHIEKPFDFAETYARIMSEHTGLGMFAIVADRIERELAVGVGERR